MNKRAFTMAEILIVMVMMAVMAAWAIPQYGRAMNRARARNAIQNLTIIHSANTLYRARNNKNCSSTVAPGNVCPNLTGNGTTTGVNHMNGTNSLNIIPSGVTYVCGDDLNTCTATVSTATITLNLNNPIVDGTNPACADGGTNICP